MNKAKSIEIQPDGGFVLTDDEDEEAGAGKKQKKDYQGVKTPKKRVMDDMGLGTKKRQLGAADFTGSGNDGSSSNGAF